MEFQAVDPMFVRPGTEKVGWDGCARMAGQARPGAWSKNTRNRRSRSTRGFDRVILDLVGVDRVTGMGAAMLCRYKWVQKMRHGGTNLVELNS